MVKIVRGSGDMLADTHTHTHTCTHTNTDMLITILRHHSHRRSN